MHQPNKAAVKMGIKGFFSYIQSETEIAPFWRTVFRFLFLHITSPLNSRVIFTVFPFTIFPQNTIREKELSKYSN